MIPFSQFLLHFQQSIWKEITISISSWAENNKTYVSSPEKQLKLKNKPASTEILYRKSWHEVCMWQRATFLTAAEQSAKNKQGITWTVMLSDNR